MNEIEPVDLLSDRATSFFWWQTPLKGFVALAVRPEGSKPLVTHRLNTGDPYYC